jgi:hypothetical protein
MACRCCPKVQLQSPPDARRSLKVAGAEALIFPARSPPREMNTDTPRACCAATAARFSTKPLAGASHVFNSVPFGLHLQEKGTRVHTPIAHNRSCSLASSLNFPETAGLIMALMAGHR